MRKILLITSLIILTYTSVKSQEKIQIGVKGGINFTNMNSAEFVIDKDYNTGFHIGVLAEIPFGNNFSLQPEILYSTYGLKGKEIMLGGSALPMEYSLDYIQALVLGKIYLIKNLSIEIGPSFNFLINDKKIWNSRTIDDVGENFEFSGILGISYKTNTGLFGSFRYTRSFTNALQGNSSVEKNYGLLIGIGYMF